MPASQQIAGGEALGRALLGGVASRVRSVKAPLGGLAFAAAAAALCGTFLHPQGFAAFFAVLAVAARGLAWPWPSAQGARRLDQLRLPSAPGAWSRSVPSSSAIGSISPAGASLSC
ncbi:hypothetical protein OJF2_09870 [Aquisphaera giovannonii]|uniref:Uncharacterized protein n=1 Tax=Aquisphaera giovannonii TaxID=406548 RepID=A0A5B9VY11_9BACT|nr:hypothetical protein [Aquisphaera giovannonii]QEH32510.1 hypothetical protein OJF2_09870 [Aquisphaera giovannonii]